MHRQVKVYIAVENRSRRVDVNWLPIEASPVSQALADRSGNIFESFLIHVSASRSRVAYGGGAGEEGETTVPDTVLHSSQSNSLPIRTSPCS